MNWSYGVTTVPERAELLDATLKSLAAAGFDRPRLFVDGSGSHLRHLGLPVTEHGCETTHDAATRALSTWGNWITALWELYLREPVCERYAIFQDDLLAVKNLRAYLDRCRYPDGTDGRPPGFWNLVTLRGSEWAVVDNGTQCGWVQGASITGQVPNERGLQQCSGALGLVFNRRAVQIILGDASVVGKCASTERPRNNIDGAVVTAMNEYRHDPRTGERWEFGWREYVHGPSLLSHTGTESIARQGKTWTTNADTFPGENFDALTLSKRPG